MVTVICNGTLFKGIKAVFLDKDGTLANVSTYLKRLGIRQAQLIENKIPGTYSLVLKALGISSDGVIFPAGLMAVGSRQETIMGTATAAAMQGCAWGQAVELATTALATADRQYVQKAPHTPLLPGALDFLQWLRHTGLKISMVSADGQANLEDFVAHYQLQTYFDHLQGTSLSHPSKTAPSFLQAACDAIGVAPHEGLVIGDAITDLQVAESAGGFIGFLGGWQPPLLPDTIALPEMLAKLTIKAVFATELSQIQLAPDG
ncbi:MAG: HAD family hydrolase [Cyanobacteria bacterium P01_D01_bin.56]